LEACIFVVNEEQAFEASCFKWKLYYGWSKVKLKVDWVSNEDINQDV
jgi:hypothetical protein